MLQDQLDPKVAPELSTTGIRIYDRRVRGRRMAFGWHVAKFEAGSAVTGATLVVTSALLLVTKKLWFIVLIVSVMIHVRRKITARQV